MSNPPNVPKQLSEISLTNFAERFARITADKTNVSFFLGAGASIKSGIPGAATLLQQWKANNRTKKDSYSEGIEDAYPLPSERVKLFFNLTQSPTCQPSQGYYDFVYLQKHLRPLLNMVLTTNFDNLIERAAEGGTINLCPDQHAVQYAVHWLNSPDQQPVVMKLHGDYRTLNLSNTQQELAKALTSPAPFPGRVPIPATIAELVRDHIYRRRPHYLVFVGYGGNDANVRDFLNGLLEVHGGQPALEYGSVFWCSSQQPSGCLLADWLRKVGAAWVNLPNDQGFDGLMAALSKSVGVPTPVTAHRGLPVEAEAIEAVYLDYSAIPWPQLLNGATEVDIFCDYLSSWIAEQKNVLLPMLRAGVPLRFHFPAPTNESAMTVLCQRFPDKLKNLQDARDKIMNDCVPKLLQLNQETVAPNQAQSTTMKIFLTDAVFNWTLHLLGKKKALLSIYEHNRQQRIGSPALLLDLEKSESMSKYIEKEVAYLRSRSQLLFPPKL